VAYPNPVPGLVIRYSYLWAHEYQRGLEEGLKDRPCAIVLVATDTGDGQEVTVLPITHTPPSDPRLVVEIPMSVKQRLRLDHERSWVVLSEANRFFWHGPDLRPVAMGDMASVSYGPLPYALFEDIRQKFISAIRARRAQRIPRSE